MNKIITFIFIVLLVGAAYLILSSNPVEGIEYQYDENFEVIGYQVNK